MAQSPPPDPRGPRAGSRPPQRRGPPRGDGRSPLERLALGAPCPRCEKPQQLCVCDVIRPVDNAVEVLFLQHPQEPDRTLGSAILAQLCLSRAQIAVGLSWANLSAAVGRPVDPKAWGALYLGAAAEAPPGPGLHLAEAPGAPLPRLEGIVVLDGTWSQAKALWWRNAWLLKLHRLVLVPQRSSLYGRLRKEPRRECLSSLEATAEALEALGAPPDDGRALRAVFGTLLQRARDLLRDEAPGAARGGAGPAVEPE
ncbi:MAG: DTW domain-containing protein [Deltaproteobacteria bacterium]|nr:DTW domain-containing protein [Deltaproteobacteria bacterium]